MSSLTFIEKRTLESFLQMSGGYVLNFSNRTFAELVQEITGLNIDDEKFSVKGTSKANRLRAIWESEPDQLVGRLLMGLTEYAVLPEHMPEPDRLSLVPRCQEIAARLLREADEVLDSIKAEVFISYRRDDAGAEAQLINGLLKQRLGASKVFMDVSSILPGAQWPDEITRNLETASTVVVVIGPDWLVAGQDEWGRRRIDNQSDWVRRELESALQNNKRVIPVLVKGAKALPEHALPASLSALFKRQYIEIRRDFWEHDVKLLESVLIAPMPAPPPVGARSSVPISDPLAEPTAAEIKRQRDLKQLRGLFRWISLGAMDRFIYWLGYNGWITNEGHSLWERMGGLIESSRFDLRDSELKARLIAFMRAWGRCFTHYEHMDQHRNGKVFFFNVHDGDEGKYIREQNIRAKFNGEQAAPLKAALDHFLDHVREHYLEIDLETAGQDGLDEYQEEEAQLMSLIRLQRSYDHDH